MRIIFRLDPLTFKLIRSILNFSLNYQSEKYIKSFSKGQITIPKEIRDGFGLGDVFWLRLYVENKKIVAEPVEPVKNTGEYSKKLLKVKGDWFDKNDYKKIRSNLKKRLDKNE